MASLGGLLQVSDHRRESGLQLHMILIDVSWFCMAVGKAQVGLVRR
jgi:hypothetical protein